jgi:hypothetical protein
MDKLSYMKSPLRNFREMLRPTKYFVQPKFTDRFVKYGIAYKHTWAQMGHMHDLRVWTLAYAPATKGNIVRLQEIHELNGEIWYVIFKGIFHRILFSIPLFFFITRFAKKRYCKTYNNDSHDPNFREVTAHM